MDGFEINLFEKNQLSNLTLPYIWWETTTRFPANDRENWCQNCGDIYNDVMKYRHFHYCNKDNSSIESLVTKLFLVIYRFRCLTIIWTYYLSACVWLWLHSVRAGKRNWWMVQPLRCDYVYKFGVDLLHGKYITMRPDKNGRHFADGTLNLFLGRVINPSPTKWWSNSMSL